MITEDENDYHEDEDDSNDDFILDDEKQLANQKANIITENFSFNDKKSTHKEIVENKTTIVEEKKETVVEDTKEDLVLKSAMILINSNDKSKIDLKIDLQIDLPDLEFISVLSEKTKVDVATIVKVLMKDSTIKDIIINTVEENIVNKIKQLK